MGGRYMSIYLYPYDVLLGIVSRVNSPKPPIQYVDLIGEVGDSQNVQTFRDAHIPYYRC